MGNRFLVLTLSKKLALISRGQKDLFKLNRKVVDKPSPQGERTNMRIKRPLDLRSRKILV